MINLKAAQSFCVLLHQQKDLYKKSLCERIWSSTGFTISGTILLFSRRPAPYNVLYVNTVLQTACKQQKSRFTWCFCGSGWREIKNVCKCLTYYKDIFAMIILPKRPTNRLWSFTYHISATILICTSLFILCHWWNHLLVIGLDNIHFQCPTNRLWSFNYHISATILICTSLYCATDEIIYWVLV